MKSKIIVDDSFDQNFLERLIQEKKVLNSLQNIEINYCQDNCHNYSIDCFLFLASFSSVKTGKLSLQLKEKISTEILVNLQKNGKFIN